MADKDYPSSWAGIKNWVKYAIRNVGMSLRLCLCASENQALVTFWSCIGYFDFQSIMISYTYMYSMFIFQYRNAIVWSLNADVYLEISWVTFPFNMREPLGNFVP